MKKVLNDVIANCFINAAIRLGFTYKIIDTKPSKVQIFHSKYQLSFISSLKSYNLGLNSYQSKKISKNKEQTYKLLRKYLFPVPNFVTFTNALKAQEYAYEKLKNKKPIVIKPVCGTSAEGVWINPLTKTQIKEAIRDAFAIYNKITIEEMISGNHYRITVIDSEIVAITQRIPANVICNGVNTVSQLIEQKNIMRKKIDLQPIILRRKDLYYLKSSNINLSSIYPKGKKIILQQGCLFTMGERKRINIEKIPAINKKLFVNVIGKLNLRFGGVDYISPDITKPHTLIKSAINEINSAPHPDLHYFESYPYDNYAAEKIIGRIFRKKTSKEKRYLKQYYIHDKTYFQFPLVPNDARIN